MATKKSTAKKIGAKKTAPKKAKSKTKPAASIPKAIMPSDAFDGIPDNVDCICMQKNLNGKFYNFKLQEGRWVQASAIPFPTKEICEDACC
ncbi:MAG TPA: hypothetical protein VIJ92_06050 [Ginsengibacter sp.]